MKYFIVATTAINRPMLHNDNMGEWIEWFLDVNKKDNVIKWFINIDIVDKLNTSYADTKSNFERIIGDRVDTTFLSHPNGKGNFLEACKRLSSNIVKYVDSLNLSQRDQKKIKIIWLEDDWKLSKVTQIPLSYIVQNYTTDNSHTNLSFNRNNYIWALAPSIISYKLWKNLFYSAWNSETNQIDPEHCVGLYYRKLFGNPDQLCNVTVINKSVKDTYLGEKHMTYPESYYTYHNDKYQINNNDRYVFKDCLTSYLGDKMAFIRITPSFCVDGCTYGRKFLEKYNIEKSHASDVNQFYTDSNSTLSNPKKDNENPEKVSDTPKKANNTNNLSQSSKEETVKEIPLEEALLETVEEPTEVLEIVEEEIVEVSETVEEEIAEEAEKVLKQEKIIEEEEESLEEVLLKLLEAEVEEEEMIETNKILLNSITSEPLIILEEKH